MKLQRNLFFNIVIILTLCAIGLHFYLTQKYYALQFGSLTESSACNVSSLLNCDVTSASRYSSLWGYPMALWGLVTNTLFLFFALISRFQLASDTEQSDRWTLIGAGFIAGVSLVMGLISVTMVKSICIFCFATYLISFFNFGVLFSLVDSKTLWSENLRLLFSSEKWVLGMGAAVPVCVLLLSSFFTGQLGLGDTKMNILVAEKIQSWKNSPVTEFNNEKGLIIGASENPQMTIVEFADFMCPHCKHAAPTLEAFTLSRPGVRLIFKPFPLDGTCNPDPALKGYGDGSRCFLASIVMCEEKLNKQGWKAHHFIFENQEKIREWGSNEQVANQWCSYSHSDCQNLNSCISSEEIRKEIAELSEEGIKAQVQGTPAIFVNGRSLQGGQLIPVLEKALESL